MFERAEQSSAHRLEVFARWVVRAAHEWQQADQQEGRLKGLSALCKATFLVSMTKLKEEQANPCRLLHMVLHPDSRLLPTPKKTRKRMQVTLIGEALPEDFFVTDAHLKTPLALALSSDHREVRQAVAKKIFSYLNQFNPLGAHDYEPIAFEHISEPLKLLTQFVEILQKYYLDKLGKRLDWNIVQKIFCYFITKNVKERQQAFIELLEKAHQALDQAEVDALIARVRTLSIDASRGFLGRSSLFDELEPILGRLQQTLERDDVANFQFRELHKLRHVKSEEEYNSIRERIVERNDETVRQLEQELAAEKRENAVLRAASIFAHRPPPSSSKTKNSSAEQPGSGGYHRRSSSL